MLDSFKCDTCDSVSGVYGASGEAGSVIVNYVLEDGWICKFLYVNHYLVMCPNCIRREKINKITKNLAV